MKGKGCSENGGEESNKGETCNGYWQGEMVGRNEMSYATRCTWKKLIKMRSLDGPSLRIVVTIDAIQRAAADNLALRRDGLISSKGSTTP